MPFSQAMFVQLQKYFLSADRDFKVMMMMVSIEHSFDFKVEMCI